MRTPLVHKLNQEFAALVSAVVVSFLTSLVHAVMYFPGVFGPIAYTTLGTKWEPGPNAASAGPFGTPGSATWIVMMAGLGDVSGFDSRSALTTTSFFALTPSDELAMYESLIGDVKLRRFEWSPVLASVISAAATITCFSVELKRWSDAVVASVESVGGGLRAAAVRIELPTNEAIENVVRVFHSIDQI